MDKRYELIVFDWDGTLMDSAGTIVACIQAAARDLDLEPPTEERARHVIGLGLAEALRYALPDLDESRHAELADRYRYHYLSQDHALTLFPGTLELMKDLQDRGYRLAVATGKSRKGLDRALDFGGLRRYFEATRCADECHSKPHPQMLDELMAEIAVPPRLTLMVGDTTHDLQMALNAGVDGLAVTYGAHDRATLMSLAPVACVDSPAELSHWFSSQA